MEDVKLFGSWSSPFYNRVKWGLELKGIKYEYIEEDLRNKSSLLLQYNPIHKKVPVLVHNGKPICESLIILEYLEDTWPHLHPLLPKDPYQRAQARFWAKFVEEKTYTFWDLFLATGEEHDKIKAKCLDFLTSVEEHCELANNSTFITEEYIGIADIALGSLIYWQQVLEDIMQVKVFETGIYPNLYKWFDNFKQDPIIKNHLLDQQKLFLHLKNLRYELLGTST